jgi:hypothetical protein
VDARSVERAAPVPSVAVLSFEKWLAIQAAEHKRPISIRRCDYNAYVCWMLTRLYQSTSRPIIAWSHDLTRIRMENAGQRLALHPDQTVAIVCIRKQPQKEKGQAC